MTGRAGSSVERLRELAERLASADDELVAEVRRADAAGIPRARIARAIGRSRNTVIRWCDGQR